MAFYRFLECKKLRRKCSHAIDDRCVERMLLLCDSLQLDLQLGMGLLQKLLHLHQRLRLHQRRPSYLLRSEEPRGLLDLDLVRLLLSFFGDPLLSRRLASRLRRLVFRDP